MRMVGFRSGNGLSSKNSPISKSKRFSSEELSSRGISNRWNHLERLDLLQSDDLNGQHEELHSRSVSYMEESSSVIGSNEHLDQNNDQTNNFSSVDSCTNCDDTISISSSSRARRKGSVKISKLLNGRRESKYCYTLG